MFDNLKIIDLSQEHFSEMPTNKGFPETKWSLFRSHSIPEIDTKYGSFYIGNLFTCEHSGTHVDSISHVDNRIGAKHINQMPLNFFMGKGIAIDFVDIKDGDEISANMVKDRLKYYNLKLHEGSIFLYSYGHYKKYYPTSKYLTSYAGLSEEAAEYIYGECGVINIGTDAPSIDKFGNLFPCHSICKKYQRTNTENLCNLEQLIGKEFYFVGLPIKIRNGSGAPTRAIAILNE